MRQLGFILLFIGVTSTIGLFGIDLYLKFFNLKNQFFPDQTFWYIADIVFIASGIFINVLGYIVIREELKNNL
jgi:hypothetical protein